MTETDGLAYNAKEVIVATKGFITQALGWLAGWLTKANGVKVRVFSTVPVFLCPEPEKEDLRRKIVKLNKSFFPPRK